MRFILSGVLLCLLLFPVLAYANQEIERKNNHIELQGGIFFPLHGFDFNRNFDFQNGFDIGIRYTHYLVSDYWGVSFRANRIEYESNTENFPGFKEYFELHTAGLGMGLAFRYPVDKLPSFKDSELANRFDLVAELGFMFNANTANNVYEYSGSGRLKDKNTGTAWGLYAEAGLRYYINETFTAGGLLRYLYDDQRIEGYLHDIDMSGISLLLTLGIAFDLNRKVRSDCPAQVCEDNVIRYTKDGDAQYEYYIVKRGDSLEHIAYMFYNSVDYWPLVYCVDFNRGQILQSPNRIEPGQRLKIRKNPTDQQKAEARKHNHPGLKETGIMCEPPLYGL